MTARLGICATLVLAAWIFAGQAQAGESSASISVQGVQATAQGKNADKPDIDAGLKAYANILKKLGYGKYEDLGKGSGSAAAGKSADVTIGGYTVTLTVEQIGGGATSIKYLVKKGDEEVVKGPLSLTKDKPKLIQFGTQNAVILFLQLK